MFLCSCSESFYYERKSSSTFREKNILTMDLDGIVKWGGNCVRVLCAFNGVWWEVEEGKVCGFSPTHSKHVLNIRAHSALETKVIRFALLRRAKTERSKKYKHYWTPIRLYRIVVCQVGVIKLLSACECKCVFHSNIKGYNHKFFLKSFPKQYRKENNGNWYENLAKKRSFLEKVYFENIWVSRKNEQKK